MRFTKTIATALAVTVGALSFVSSADARRRQQHFRPHGGHHHHGHHYYGGYGYGCCGYGYGYGYGVGLFGFAAGALLGSALARPYYGSGYGYGAPAYGYGAPVSGTYQPWTPEWISYCHSKYRSFDESTGNYLGYDGEYHFCR